MHVINTPQIQHPTDPFAEDQLTPTISPSKMTKLTHSFEIVKILFIFRLFTVFSMEFCARIVSIRLTEPIFLNLSPAKSFWNMLCIFWECFPPLHPSPFRPNLVMLKVLGVVIGDGFGIRRGSQLMGLCPQYFFECMKRWETNWLRNMVVLQP